LRSLKVVSFNIPSELHLLVRTGNLKETQMNASKEDLIAFLEKEVLHPAETHPEADTTIKKKVRYTRMRIGKLQTAEGVEKYFWSAMATDRGIDTYTRLRRIDAITFEDVRREFKRLCGRE